MTVTRVVTTVLPHTTQGVRIADEMVRRLTQQGCFSARKETTQTITIIESCTITISEVEE